MPLTVATPSTIAIAVSAVRSFRAEQPLERERGHRRRSPPSPRRSRAATRPASSRTMQPVGQEEDAVGDRGGARLVGDHHDRLPEVVRPSGAGARGSRRPSSSRGCRSARRRTRRRAARRARGRSRRAAAGRRRARPDGARAGRRARRDSIELARTTPRSGFSPAIASGSRMFSSAFSIGSRLKNWKTKPMCSRRSFVRSVSLSVVISVPAIVTRARGRLVEAGEDVHQRRLARPGRPHHGGQLARARRRRRRRGARRPPSRPRRSVGSRRARRRPSRSRSPCACSPRSTRLSRAQGARAEHAARGADNRTLALGGCAPTRSGDGYDARQRRRCASASTSPRIPTISSISASPATSGGEICTTGSPRSSARQIRPGLEERRREVAAQQRLALGVVEGLPSSPCP